jgi:hypothetical protein
MTEISIMLNVSSVTDGKKRVGQLCKDAIVANSEHSGAFEFEQFSMTDHDFNKAFLMDSPLGMTGHVLEAITNDGLKLIISESTCYLQRRSRAYCCKCCLKMTNDLAQFFRWLLFLHELP